MSLSGAIGFVINNELKVTYNHFDSNPEELGSEVVDFIRDIVESNKISELKEKLLNIEMVDKTSIPTPDQISLYSKFSNTNISDGSLKQWRVLIRRTQGIETFRCFMVGNLHHMIDDIGFFHNKDMCLYAYILNFDTLTIDFFDLGEFKGDLSFETLTYDKRYSNKKWIDIIFNKK